MNEQDKILKEVIFNINKTNHELNRLKIILKDKTNYTRTIEQTENIIKTIMILVEWLNGKDIAFNSEKRNKLRKCVSVPLITTWSCDKYEVLFNN